MRRLALLCPALCGLGIALIYAHAYHVIRTFPPALVLALLALVLLAAVCGIVCAARARDREKDGPFWRFLFAELLCIAALLWCLWIAGFLVLWGPVLRAMVKMD